MNRPCGTIYICQPGLDGDNNPLANLTSEGIELLDWRSLRFGNWNPLNPLGRDPNNPQNPNTPNWWANSCLGVCVSTISQEDADECAARNEELCVNEPPEPPPPFPPDDPPPPNPPQQRYYSDETECTSVCPDGTTFTYTLPAGVYTSLSQELANRLAHDTACQRAVTHRFCLSDLTATRACVNQEFSAAIGCTGGTGPFTWELIGSLPDGLTYALDESKTLLTITGTPTYIDNFNFSFRVSDAEGTGAIEKDYTIYVLGITTNTPLPSSKIFWPYSTVIAADGGSGYYYFYLTSGSLPPGLTLETTGWLHGTCADPGGYAEVNYSFTVSVIDTNLEFTCSKAFTLLVEQPAPYWEGFIWDGMAACAYGLTAESSSDGSGGSWAGTAKGGSNLPAYALACGHAYGYYTGPDAQCQLILIVSSASSETNIGVGIKATGQATMWLRGGIEWSGVGTHVLNFTITAGINKYLEIVGLSACDPYAPACCPDPCRAFITAGLGETNTASFAVSSL